MGKKSKKDEDAVSSKKSQGNSATPMEDDGASGRSKSKKKDKGKKDKKHKSEKKKKKGKDDDEDAEGGEIES